MTLFLLGVNHRTAGLADREALALAPSEVFEMLSRFTRRGVLRESLVLSTCNRTEVYAAASEITGAEQHVRDAILRMRTRDLLAPGPHRYLVSGPAVADHLFRVACGLDSMVLGDVQILGQVKDAYTLARQVGSTGVLLDRLFEAALHAGKRARGETLIGTGHVSMSSAAVDMAAARAGGLAGRRVLVIGAGETARLAALHAAEHKPETLGVPAMLHDADVVISATRAPCTVLQAADVRTAMAARPARPLLLLDLAMPRDIETTAGEIPGVTLRTLDTIQAVVGQALAISTAEVPRVEAIAAEEAERFAGWMRSLGATPTLVALREHFERIRVEELERGLRHASADERDRAERLTRVLVNRLLHVPMLRLKDADPTSADGQLWLKAARELFALGGTGAGGSRRHDA